MKKLGFEIVILLFLVGYIILVEVGINRHPDSTYPLIAGVVIAALYTLGVLYSPRQIKLARWWAAVSIVAFIYWAYLLVNLLIK